MPGWKRKLAVAISFAAAPFLRRMGGRRGLRILLFHAVGTRLPHDSYGISCSQSLFRDVLDALQANPQFHFVPLSLESLATDKINIAFSFDDGYRDNLTFVAPLLAELRIPMTLFVISSCVFEKKRFYLTPPELKELAGFPNVQIGSHTASHVPLTRCSSRELQEELVGSKKVLEDFLGREIAMLSYPFGAVNQRVCEAAASAGYRLACCSRFGINRRGISPLLLRRTEVVASDAPALVLQKALGAWDWYKAWEPLLTL